tara:strand:+ start:355 stop:576 length:222 start_codon:yes stop_codon:yes gene_type:complete
MKFITENIVSEKLVNSIAEERTLELAKRLEDENHKTPFEGLKDWHLQSGPLINKHELKSDYIDLLYKELVNEN